MPSIQARDGRAGALDARHRACPGCGETLGARHALDAAMRATGDRLIAVNAAGCLAVLSTPFLETSWRIPWMHSLSDNAASIAAGIAAALQARGRSGDVRVIGQGGDPGVAGTSFTCLSGMFERDDDVLYICYDRHADVLGKGESVPLIALAHEIPYVATATVAELRDLEHKVRRAMSIRGARYIHVLAPCPLAWGMSAKDTTRLARLAKESGLFPVFEATRGELAAVSPIRRQIPVTDYLRPQRRYAHLLGPPPDDAVISRIQWVADHTILRFHLLEEA
jgi:pyruvate ferredoxin oxidoreductase beta subunit